MKSEIDLLKRWLDNNEADFKLSELFSILNALNNPESEELLNLYFEKHWEGLSVVEYKTKDDIEAIYSEINKKILLRKTKKKNILLQRSKVFYKYFSRAAAIIVIPLALLVLFPDKHNVINKSDTKKTITEYFSPPGTRSRIYLPDSTEIWLNADSRMVINSDYGVEKREVVLSGEAFFAVKKNIEKPFFVNTSNMVIKVTGTTFNLSAYPDKNSIETVLLTGEIRLNYKEGSNSKELVLKPHHKAIYSKSKNTMAIQTIRTNAYNSWKDGKLIFNNNSLSEIVSILERWFNVSIKITDKELYEYKFTATLDNRSLDQILMFLSCSSPIDYTFSDNKVNLFKKSNLHKF